MTKINELEKEFLQFVKKMDHYREAISLVNWDMRTGAPRKGIEQRSETIGLLSTEVFQLSTSEQMEEYINELERSQLSEMTKKTVLECKKEFERNKKIPGAEYKEYVILQAKSEAKWEEAKEAADFRSFLPYLEKIVSMTKRFVDYWGYDSHPYNRLLDDYEPGMTVNTLDRVFGQLREQLVPIVQQVNESSAKPRTDFLFQEFPIEKQRAFSQTILKQLGYDFEAGRLDETVHPFAITINRNDVRVTTKYDEKDFRTAIFGTIHECGHAIYEQNISADLIGTPLCDGTSMGIHESQSLFFENFIGRNRSFWQYHYDQLKNYSTGQFDDVSVDEFYRAVNVAGPSLIRIEADELTYPLHIIVRYELEKAIFSNEIAVKDLPGIWNEKMEDYLGVRPSHDGEGVLQDVHWAAGLFGYFPSYALGYIYAAQFKATMDKSIANFDELLARGEIEPIRTWLTENIHQYGKLKSPAEIIRDVTGENINPAYLVQYLRQKYGEIYQF